MKKLYSFLETIFGKIVIVLLLFIFLLLLELNNIGLSFRDRITLGSTLDFSWFSDLIERNLHGYILGRDFTFTYGPLFQFIYSLPSTIFHIPSYISVALAPILSFIIIFIILLYIAKNISKNIFEQITYLLFVFIILGLLIASGTDIIKGLVPMVFAVFLFNTLNKKFSWSRIFFVSLVPTIFGLYTYNLFFTTCLIAVLVLAFFTFKKRENKHFYKFLLILPLIAVFQIMCSFLLTQNGDYIRYSFDSIANYRYVLDLPWTHDRDNILLIFPLVLVILVGYLRKTNYISSQKRNILFVLIFASLSELDYAISRSDAGHLLWAFYPSIITFYSIIFVLAPKTKILFPIAFILYLLVPFKPTFYNTLAPKNILTVFQTIRQKPEFFSIYKLPDNYYYSQKEINNLAEFAKFNKNVVYIYPYDSYILNSVNTTYNSFSLGLYTYSNSAVEENTVNEFKKTPPKYIILGIDTKGTLNLDDIPNFTRNPQLALWIIRNYSIEKQTEKYFILTYSPNKKINNSSCQIIRLTINLTEKRSIRERAEETIKPAIYYLGNVRLPYAPSVNNYLLFQNINTSTGVKNLFQSNKEYTKLPSQYLNGLTITRVDPFTSKKKNTHFDKNQYLVGCIKPD